jgi:hypothetical protein
MDCIIYWLVIEGDKVWYLVEYYSIVELFSWYILRRGNKVFVNFFFKSKISDEGILLVFFRSKSKIFFFYASLRTSPQKINAFLKKTKMYLIELIGLCSRNKEQLLLNLTSILKSNKNNVKNGRKKRVQNFLYLGML